MTTCRNGRVHWVWFWYSNEVGICDGVPNAILMELQQVLAIETLTMGYTVASMQLP